MATIIAAAAPAHSEITWNTMSDTDKCKLLLGCKPDTLYNLDPEQWTEILQITSTYLFNATITRQLELTHPNHPTYEF